MISNYTIKEPTVEGVLYDGTNLDEIERWLFFKNAFFTLTDNLSKYSQVDDMLAPSTCLRLQTSFRKFSCFIYYIISEGDLVVLDKNNVCKDEKSDVFVVKEEDVPTRFEFKDFVDNHLSPSPTPPWDEVAEEIWPPEKDIEPIENIEPIEKDNREINKKVLKDYARVTLSTRLHPVKNNGYDRLMQANRKPIVSTLGIKSFNL